MIKFNPSTVIPNAAELEKSALSAIKRIDSQLSKLPPVQKPRGFNSPLPPLKKPASAADNFPGIYANDIVFFSHRAPEATKTLSAEAAIKEYGFFG